MESHQLGELKPTVTYVYMVLVKSQVDLHLYL